MLVVTRKEGEQIQIGDDITITVARVSSRAVRIGVQAPPGVTISRDELLRRLSTSSEWSGFDGGVQPPRAGGDGSER